jgi:Tfp pilus assembly protein PilF
MPQGVFIGFPGWMYWLVLFAFAAVIVVPVLILYLARIKSRRSTTRDLYLSRAALRVKNGDIKAALQDYGKAIELDPGSPTPYMRRAMLYQAKGDPDAAAKNYQAALRLAPADWPYRAKIEAALKKLRP